MSDLPPLVTQEGNFAHLLAQQMLVYLEVIDFDGNFTLFFVLFWLTNGFNLRILRILLAFFFISFRRGFRSHHKVFINLKVCKLLLEFIVMLGHSEIIHLLFLLNFSIIVLLERCDIGDSRFLRLLATFTTLEVL